MKLSRSETYISLNDITINNEIILNEGDYIYIDRIDLSSKSIITYINGDIRGTQIPIDIFLLSFKTK